MFIQISGVRTGAGRDDDLQTRTQPGARTRDRSPTIERNLRGNLQTAAEQIDLQLAGVQRHYRSFPELLRAARLRSDCYRAAVNFV